MPQSRVVLAGSERPAPLKAEVVGDASSSERIPVTIEVRRKQQQAPSTRQGVLERSQFASRFGASDADLAAVRTFAEQSGLQVISQDAGKREVRVVGTATALNTAFGTKIVNVKVASRVFRQQVGAITIPKELDGIIVAVVGLDTRPIVKPKYVSGKALVFPAAEFAPGDVAKAYNFPPGDGSNSSIAMLEFGGGFSQDDLTEYCHSLNLSMPSVTVTTVNGGSNSPGVDPASDGEVMLDIEVAGAIAPKSQILVYFSTNDEQGFLAAIKAAVLDPPNPPSVLSISWGGPEPGWSQQTLQAVDRAFQDAGTLGVPVVVAAGDEGSTDGTGGLAVDFPASSPNAIACGGTFLQVNGGAVTESVWNDSTGSTGGGVSTFFSIPAYQANANVPAGPGGFQGRGTPDVAGNAASQSAYKVRVDGINTNEWGTSAVAPLWAGLIALCTQALGKPIADLHSFIYQAGMQQTAFNDITQGNNYSQGIQFYSAGAGWDPCTGLGTPNGQALLASLKAGVPTPAPGTGTTNPPGNNPPGSDLSTVATVAITAINAIVALVQTIAIGSDFAPPAGQPPSAAKAAGK